jgi:hypothetical protein
MLMGVLIQSFPGNSIRFVGVNNPCQASDAPEAAPDAGTSMPAWPTIANPRHLHVEVDPDQQRTGDALLVARHRRSGAGARPGRATKVSARAGVWFSIKADSVSLNRKTITPRSSNSTYCFVS